MIKLNNLQRSVGLFTILYFFFFFNKELNFLSMSYREPCIFCRWFYCKMGFPGTSLVAQRVKNLPAIQETWVQSLDQEDPWRRECQPTQVFLPTAFLG